MPDKYIIKRSPLTGRGKVMYACDACSAELTNPLRRSGEEDCCPKCGAHHVVPGLVELENERKAKAERAAQLNAEKERRKREGHEAYQPAGNWAIQRKEERERKARLREERRHEHVSRKYRAKLAKSGHLISYCGLAGVCLAMLGFFDLVYFLFVFETTAPDSTTLNIGLLNDRLCFVIVGVGLCVSGVIYDVCCHLLQQLAGVAYLLDGKD